MAETAHGIRLNEGNIRAKWSRETHTSHSCEYPRTVLCVALHCESLLFVEHLKPDRLPRTSLQDVDVVPQHRPGSRPWQLFPERNHRYAGNLNREPSCSEGSQMPRRQARCESLMAVPLLRNDVCNQW